MTRLDRYLFREIALPLVISVTLVVLAVFLFQARRLATAALGLGLTAEDAVIIFVSALPPFLMLAIPIAYLLSVLVGFGRLSADLELLAMKSMGNGPFRIARVPLVTGVVISAAAIPVAIYGEPYGLRMLHARLVDVGLRNLTHAIQPGVFNEDFRGSALYAGALDGRNRLSDVLLYDERDPERPLLLSAQSGEFETRPEAGIAFLLERGEIHLGEASNPDKYDRIRFGKARIGLDAEGEISRRTQFVSVLGRMTSREMLEEVQRLGPGSPLGRRMEKLYWRRLAFPSMAFVLGAMGCAIALTGSVRSRARNALFGMLSIVSYYVFTRIADFVVVQYEGTPFLMAWIPNLLVLGTALALIARSGRPR